MSKKIDQLMLERFLNKECSVKEAKEILLWLKDENNTAEVDALMNLQWHNNRKNVKGKTNLNIIYSKILEEIANDKIKSTGISKSKVYLGIAATLSLLIVSIFSFFYISRLSDGLEMSAQEVVKSTGKGEKLTTKLPDGTFVTLNAESEIIFLTNFNGETRKVHLEGEAYFNVAKNADKPFIVKSGPVETRAIGTAFNVRADPDSDIIVVSLAEGKVVVNSVSKEGEQQKDYFLLPGDEIHYNSNGKYLAQGNFDYKHILWKDGILVFDNTDIVEFKNIIEKWYGVVITYKNRPDKKWRFTSEYRNESLENVLEGLKYSKNIDYVIENDSVEIIFN